jgi:hypothetical protein
MRLVLADMGLPMIALEVPILVAGFGRFSSDVSKAFPERGRSRPSG